MTIKSSNDIIAALKGRKLMLILGAYVVTSIASIMIVKYNYFRMYKDVSDKGYKINIKNITNEIKPNKKKTN